MPDVDKVVGALQQALEAAGQAQSAVAQLGGRAQQVQSRAGASGFRGVADRIGAARHRLKQIREMQAVMVTTAKGTAEMVHRVTADMSPADVVSTLSPASQQMGSASTTASGISAELDKLNAEIAAALRGGQPGPLIALANQVKRALTQVVGNLETAKRATDETIAAARQTGNF
jgi:hypothetical protein